MAFSETILLPKVLEVPDFVVFYKRVIHNITGNKIKVFSLDSPPVETTIRDCKIYDDMLTFLTDVVPSDSHNNVLAEVDILDEPLYINFKNIVEYITDDVENRLIQEMRRWPFIAARIPKELWKHPSFKRKIDVERTKGRLKITNSSSLFVHDKLSDGPLSIINDMLDMDTARLRKIMRPPPLPPPLPPPRRSACKGSNCSISGGRRTRRFKK